MGVNIFAGKCYKRYYLIIQPNILLINFHINCTFHYINRLFPALEQLRKTAHFPVPA